MFKEDFIPVCLPQVRCLWLSLQGCFQGLEAWTEEEVLRANDVFSAVVAVAVAGWGLKAC